MPKFLSVNLAHYSGLGLGLYICKDIIKRHIGDIGVESNMARHKLLVYHAL